MWTNTFLFQLCTIFLKMFINLLLWKRERKFQLQWIENQTNLQSCTIACKKMLSHIFMLQAYFTTCKIKDWRADFACPILKKGFNKMAHLTGLRYATCPIIQCHGISLPCSFNSPSPCQHSFQRFFDWPSINFFLLEECTCNNCLVYYVPVQSKK